MGKSQLAIRRASHRAWINATPEEKEKRRVKALEYYHKNKERIASRKKRLRSVGRSTKR